LTTGRRSGGKAGQKPEEVRAGGTGKAGVHAGEVPAGVGKGAAEKPAAAPEARANEHSPAGVAGRAFWSGSITIGLVNVPVRLYTMVRDKSFPFRLLHRTDGQPLRYDRVCVKDGRVIPWADTVKGYEVQKGEFLVFDPKELAAVKPASDRKIKIEKFVFYLSLDPMYFENSYVLLPDRSEEAYNLLYTALLDLNRAGAGTVTLRTKEYPVVVHAYGGGLVLTTLRYADEVTPPHAFGTGALPAPKDTELALAKRIITELAGDFSITDYHDRYREAVLDLIDKKLAGEKLVYEELHPEEAKELMQALKETLATLGPK